LSSSPPSAQNLTNCVSLSASPSPTVATIDLSALAHNLTQVRSLLADTCQILAVVKADAYGHGAVMISRTLTQLGITRFGVSTVQEGIALREAGIRGSVLVLGAVFPNQIPDLFAHGLTPAIYDLDMALKLAQHARSRQEPYVVHIKVETGMGRLGLSPDEVVPLLQSPPFKGPLRAEGLMTHLADADGPYLAYTQAQIARFRSALSQIEAAGLSVPLVHAANSAGILLHPSSHFTLVRPGIMLYGYPPGAGGNQIPNLKPLLMLTTTVAQVRALAPGDHVSYNCSYTATRPTRIAVLPIGYADGYSRSLSNRGHVMIKGRLTRIVGRVCMDMTMVEVTEIPDIKPGDEAILIGQQGAAQISGSDLAAWQGTIPYEVLCAIGTRVPRVYRELGPHVEH